MFEWWRIETGVSQMDLNGAEKAIPELVKNLKHEDSGVRKWAIFHLIQAVEDEKFYEGRNGAWKWA